jgi:hypothetical protein
MVYSIHKRIAFGMNNSENNTLAVPVMKQSRKEIKLKK